MALPHTTPPAWPPAIAPSRFASLIRTDSPGGCSVGLIGLADDLGVKLNRGRPGAKGGPRAFRDALARYGVADPHGWEWPGVYDAGNIVPAAGTTPASLRETHRRVTAATDALLDLGLFPVAIGGGHDLTFPFARAVAARTTRPCAVWYCDAHLDVRPTPGSGMAFRSLVEECGVSSLHVHGLNEFANSREHVEWFLSHGGTIGAGTPSGPARRGPPTIVSLDLDAIDGGAAPGVSAVNPGGLPVSGVARPAFMAGRSRAVVCFDIMELNPRFDTDGRTARVAAHLFLAFLRGFALRAAPAARARSRR